MGVWVGKEGEIFWEFFSWIFFSVEVELKPSISTFGTK
jgi:hypothetical protein